ncbi:MAG: hypothetical protein ABEI52_12430, partial [Halobacteriaceae archaeon]
PGYGKTFVVRKSDFESLGKASHPVFDRSAKRTLHALEADAAVTTVADVPGDEDGFRVTHWNHPVQFPCLLNGRVADARLDATTVEGANRRPVRPHSRRYHVLAIGRRVRG